MRSIIVFFTLVFSSSAFSQIYSCRLTGHDHSFSQAEEFLEAHVLGERAEVTALGQFAQSFGSEKYEFSRPFLSKYSESKTLVFQESLEHESMSFKIIFPQSRSQHFRGQFKFVHKAYGVVSVMDLSCRMRE